MQVYRGMDIGTAKPTPADQAAVAPPRHRPRRADRRLHRRPTTGAAYDAAVATIAGRPLLVAGTGLYLAAVDRPPRRARASGPRCAAELDAEPDVGRAVRPGSTPLDPVAAGRIEPGNRRRIVRALEVTDGSGRPFSSFGPGLQAYPPTDAALIGLRWSRPALAERIEQRVTAMIDAGLLAEVAAPRTPPGCRARPRQALGYKELIDHLDGRATLDEAVAATVAAHPPVRRPPGAVVPSRPARTLVSTSNATRSPSWRRSWSPHCSA